MTTISEAFNRIENEIWKDIPNYKGYYQASNLGLIRSVSRDIHDTIKNSKRKRVFNSIIKRQNINLRGYSYTTLSKNGKNSTCEVHKLIAITFIGHTQCGYIEVIDHINNNKLDNRAENLRITTNRDNVSKSFMLKNKYSKYTGVCLDKSRNCLKSAIQIKGTIINLGRSNCELKAAYIYNTAVKNINKFNGNQKEFREYIRSIINDRQHNFRTKNI